MEKIDITAFHDGYKSSILAITAGEDYRFSKRLVAGLALSYSNTDGDFRSGGNFSTNSYGGLLFASYLPTDRTFMQVTSGYTTWSLEQPLLSFLNPAPVART